MPPSFINQQWRIRPLIACHVVALLLLASWLWAPSRALWDQFDLQLFAQQGAHGQHRLRDNRLFDRGIRPIANRRLNGRHDTSGQQSGHHQGRHGGC